MKLKNILFGFSLLTVLLSFSQTYEVIKVDIKCTAHSLTSNLNSSANDFSPFVYNNTLYFASDRSPDVLIDGENHWSKSEAINLYQGEIKGGINADAKIKNVRLVSEKFDAGSHTGPACFSVTGDTMFVSQVQVNKKSGAFHPQLYYAVRLNKKFTKLTPLPFNNPDFSYGHPFYDSNKQRLYYASNSDGGKGGKDIYYSDLSDSGWSTPQGLAEVNTAEDEVFPFLVDNIFFFATNANSKGLDIYWKLLNGIAGSSQPLEGANSDMDDFGIYVFPGMTKGFLSTNRLGDDDLMYIDIERSITVRKEMAGQFKFKTLSGLPADIKIQIIDENDFVLYETTTDKEGRFIFRELETDKSYSIRAMSEDGLDLILKNLNGEDVASLTDDEDNVFTYRNIGTDKSVTLSLIPDDMIDFNLNEGHLSGQMIYQDRPNEFPNDLQVVLIDESGIESFSSLTDDKGNFDFKKLSMSKNYLLKVPESDDELVLLIYDLKGNVVAQLKTNKNGEFTFRKIAPDYSNVLELIKEDDEVFNYKTQTIWGYFEYESSSKLSRSGLIVSAHNSDGTLIDEEFTDKDGVFRFKNLPTEKSLLFKLKENGDNFILDDFILYIYDRNGQKIAGLKRGQDGFFTYRPLGYDTDNKLSQIEEDNLEFILGKQSTKDRILVYFDSNQSQVKTSDMAVLKNIATVLKNNKGARVEINAYADAKSSDEYNLILSQKRGAWIINYLVKRGIAVDRIIINAYGESQLVDQQNDALNRRAEIHLY
ncbi:MAG: outer membrane protein OmpA-like peptidoglycan-associated protein [Crocinitomix sp.]|jgi:outer membrane protein OmpA-like peptidoglycan-associated protein